MGGGIWNQEAALSVTASEIIGNTAIGGAGGGNGSGGGVYSSGSAAFTDTLITLNQADGGNNGGQGVGGGLDVASGTAGRFWERPKSL